MPDEIKKTPAEETNLRIAFLVSYNTSTLNVFTEMNTIPHNNASGLVSTSKDNATENVATELRSVFPVIIRVVITSIALQSPVSIRHIVTQVI
jgi:hypothetical protein